MLGRDRTRTYKVRIDDLLERLHANREEHVKEFTIAHGVYQVTLIEKLELKIEALRKADEADAGAFDLEEIVAMARPFSHVSDFERAIGLLELSKRAGESIVEISADEYDAFVRNVWPWSQGFALVNGSYVAPRPRRA